MEKRKAEAEVVAEVAARAVLPVPAQIKRGNANECTVLVGRTECGWAIEGLKEHLDEYLTAPERTVGTARLQDLESFIGHVNRFKEAASALFADAGGPSIRCVFDYDTQEAPRFREHAAVYNFPLSEEWEAWKEADGSWMKQEVFAELIEERLIDLTDPADPGLAARSFAELLGVTFASPSRVLALSRGLSVRINAKVARAVNLSTGEAQLEYGESHAASDGSPLKIPGAFLLAIPVFKLGERFKVPARLRYRVREGTVLWSVALHRADLVFDTAVREACSKAEAGTGLPLFYGQPES